MQNLSAADFFKPTHFNTDTKNQIWMSIIADSHDSICHCNSPFGHLLASIFPPGHKDRDLTINQILKRDFLQECHSGGKEGESPGTAAGGTGGGFKGANRLGEDAEEDLPREELEELIAAAESTR
nr:MAG: hypothetical protein [Gammatorquevirus sp.]